PALVVDLQAIEPEVGAAALGMLGVDGGERDERPPVLGPAGQRGQAVESDVGADPLRDGPRAAAPGADPEQLASHVAGAPELSRRRGQQRLRQVRQPLNEAQRPPAEGHLRAPPRAEQVRHERHLGSHRVGEQQGRSVGRDHAAVDLGRLETRVDGNGHGRQVALAAKLVEEGPQVGERRFVRHVLDGIVVRSPSRGNRPWDIIRAVFFVFFLISGFCSLVYEVVWLRLAMAQFGVTTPLVSIVLSVFMAGLALGSWGAGRLARRLEARPVLLLRLYAAAELTIALSATAVPLLLSYGRSRLVGQGAASEWA